jgi:hypothetical protein
MLSCGAALSGGQGQRQCGPGTASPSASPVDLRGAATGLDDRNVQRLVTAILHASGTRPRTEDIDDHL